MTRAERTLAVATDVARTLAKHNVPCAVIGAVALAVHGYVRDTEDFDLATATDPFRVLGLVEKELASRYDVELNRLGAGGAGRAAVETATPNVLGPLAVADVAHLIALKLYAGGRKNELDVLELLDRNPTLDRKKLETVCKELGLESELRKVIGA